MNNSFAVVGGKPVTVTPDAVNLGIAIDLAKPDGSRTLVVPSIKAADPMDFRQFWQSYEDIVRRARRNELTMDDYAGTTISLTNPGGIGTVHSMPRLMPGQGTIIGVGAMEHPAEFAGMSDDQLAELAISKIITLTSTYDHRIIQGAQSGEFLKVMHELLLGEHGFYDEIFTSLRIPYEPVRWTRDVAHTSEGQIDKAARVIELIHAYRVRGHLMADTDPLEYHIRHHPDLDVREHELTLWDLDRTFPVGGFAGQQRMKLREILGRAPRLVLPPGRHRVHAHPGPGGAPLDPGTGGAPLHQAVAGGAAAHPGPAQRGRGVRDVPADQVRRAEAVLARGRRERDPAARRDPAPRRPRPGSTRSSSAWPTAAGSTCSPTSSASRTRRSSRSSRGTWTRSPQWAPAT